MEVKDAPANRVASDQILDAQNQAPKAEAQIAIARNDSVKPGLALEAMSSVPIPVQIAAQPFARVDQDKVRLQAQHINGDGQLLAIAWQSAGTNRAYQNALIRELVRSDTPGDRRAFYNEMQRLTPEQQTIIANAVNQAYTDGAISQADLLNLADFNRAGNGAQRLISRLNASPQASLPGGSIEALGRALLVRANANAGTKQATLDYFGAAIAFGQGEQIYAGNRGTARERIAMFEATVQINDGEFPGHGNFHQSWTTEGLTAAGRLFVDNAQLVTDFYTGVPASAATTATLAKFFSQTILNPDANALTLGADGNLIDSVNRAIGHVSAHYVGKAASADSQGDREAFSRGLGALSASINGAVAVALTRYSDKIQSNEAFRDKTVGLINSAISPLFKALPPPVAKFAGDATKDIGAAIVDQFITNPERPDKSIAVDYIDAMESSIRQLEIDHGLHGLANGFGGSRGAEIGDLQRDLNVNLGGHR